MESDDVKRPAYQWYPGDCRRDVALQACTFEARALWREMLDLMHDGEPYGHLTAGGVPITDAQLARFVGMPVGKIRRWLAELEQHQVFSRTEAGVVFSRRMVKDEHLRTVRASAGKLGGNPALLVNQSANQTANQNPTPAVAVASAVASAEESPPSPPEGFDAVDALCRLLPLAARPAWAADIAVSTHGMHGKPMTEEQIAMACRDYIAQAKFDADGMIIDANLSHFRGFMRRAQRPVVLRTYTPTAGRPSKQEVGRANLAAWLATEEPNGQ